jgi:hypothetical protein
LNANSGWLGGTGEGWERGPYYTDGLVPLAYLLDDPKLVAKARRWVDWTLGHQRADGAIGPGKNTDWWPSMVMLKALTQYQEATGDLRVVPLLERYFAYRSKELAAKLADHGPAADWEVHPTIPTDAAVRSRDHLPLARLRNRPKLLQQVEVVHG